LKRKAAYLQTGVWAKKAIKEAKFYGEVEIVASSEDKNYSYIPKGYTIPADADYFISLPTTPFTVPRYMKISTARYLWQQICRLTL